MAEPMKDLFADDVIALLAERFSAQARGPDGERFDGSGFSEVLKAKFPNLELKDRVNLVADELRARLSTDYTKALDDVVTVAETGVEGFDAWPLCSFVERHGVDHPAPSLQAMETLTTHFSCEFAIRPFLEAHLERTLEYCHRWVDHDDEAVRRLPSEGTRPYLPWGPRVQALIDDPMLGIDLLAKLRVDASQAVRRSVANHLNDVAKQHPDLVVQTLSDWSTSEGDLDKSLIRHALRTLVKNGSKAAMELLGFTPEPDIEVRSFDVSPTELELGTHIELKATVRSTASHKQRIVVDFVVHHVNSRGDHSPKVFKWSDLSIQPGESIELAKRRKIATASTRRYHAGFHRVDLQVAGARAASSGFELTNSSPIR